MAKEHQPSLIQGTPDILLVEDDPNDAKLTMLALEARGFGDRVIHVSDGTEAIDYVSSMRDPHELPRLILLDLNLRKMSGLHVLRQLKSDERTKGIPIVILTSSQLAIELVESYQIGVNSYVIKPVDGDKFAEIIAQISHYWLVVNETLPYHL